VPAWIPLAPAGAPPPGQYLSSAIYDPMLNTMTIFAGDATGATCVPTNAATMLLNANGIGAPAWVTLIPNGAGGSPAMRSGQGAVYDPATLTMTIFGGVTSTFVISTGPIVFTNDTWQLAHATGVGGAPAWKKLATKTSPTGRAPNQVGYDPTTNSMIIYGEGFVEGPLLSTWVLN
jgi:hypothetical protein